MQSDLPHTLYDLSDNKKGKNKSKRRSNKPVVQDELSMSLQKQAIEEMKQRRAAQKNEAMESSTDEGVTLEDLFNGDADEAPIISNNNG